jgi:hypothetical protein
VWLAILVCAVANGALREGVLVPHFGATVGLMLSGVLLCVCILVVSLLVVPWFGRERGATFVGIGLFWLLLTLAFEFSFGLVVQAKNWPELFAQYTFEGGNLWPLVLLVTALAPWLAARIRGTMR